MKELKMNLYNNTKSYLAIPDPATPSMEAETGMIKTFTILDMWLS